MNLNITKRRIHAWADLCTAGQWAQGKTWYHDAHVFAVELSQTYGIPLERVVGVLAVLSVQNRWDSNKRDTEAFCRAHAEHLPWPTVGTYTSQKRKAIDILTAEAGSIPTEELIGTRYAPKTRAFYDNILKPTTSYRVTIDRWILRGLGLEFTGGGGGNQYVKLYRDLEELFRLEAADRRVRPCELQAAVWCCIQQTAKAEEWDGARPGTGLAEPAPF
jgi:hypothetical protein